MNKEAFFKKWMLDMPTDELRKRRDEFWKEALAVKEGPKDTEIRIMVRLMCREDINDEELEELGKVMHRAAEDIERAVIEIQMDDKDYPLKQKNVEGETLYPYLVEEEDE